MPSGQVSPLLQVSTQARPPPSSTSAHSTGALPVAGGAKQSQASSQSEIMQTLAPSVMLEVKHPMKPVAPPTPIQLHRVLSMLPSSPMQALNSPGTTGSHALGLPLELLSSAAPVLVEPAPLVLELLSPLGSPLVLELDPEGSGVPVEDVIGVPVLLAPLEVSPPPSSSQAVARSSATHPNANRVMPRVSRTVGVSHKSKYAAPRCDASYCSAWR